MESPHKKSGVSIVVDAMGGDFAPDINIEGALLALQDAPDLHIVLVGDQSVLSQRLQKKGIKESERLKILHAEEVISMEDHASVAMRKKKKSSIHIGLQQLKDGTADAFISAGNSGAVMAVAILVLGRIEGVERPAILIKLPSLEEAVILLDAGANVDCKPSHLFQFAEMGQIYAELIEGRSNAKVGVLSNGTEEHKGNELTRETHALLKSVNFPNYVGYIEGFDIFKGTVDIIVCDGFVGNVALKLSEGLADTAFNWFRAEIQKSKFVGVLGLTLLRNVLKAFKQKFDYKPYGSAPLLGIDGMVFISHGSSNAIAIRNGILTAKKGVEKDFTNTLRKHLVDRISPAEKGSAT